MARTILVAVMVTGAALLGCGGSNDKPAEGPAEKAGKEVDQAAEDMKEGAKDAAEETGDAAEKAGDKVEEKTDP